MSRENYFDVLQLSAGFVPNPKKLEEVINKFINDTKAQFNHKLITVDQYNAKLAMAEDIKIWAQDKEAFNKDKQEFIEKQSDAVRSYFKLLDNHYEAYGKEISSWVEKYRLTDDIVKKLMKEDPEHIIEEAKVKPLPPNFIIKIFSSYVDVIKAINESKIINSVYPWASKVNDLYDFLANIMGTTADKVRITDTAALSKVIATNKEPMITKVGGGAGDNSKPFRDVFSQLADVFDVKRPELRDQYDNTLRYHSLDHVFKTLNETAPEIKKDDKFASNIIKQIKTKFDDDELALAIYNKEAKLVGDPYEPPKVIVSMRCSNCGSITNFNNHEQAKKGKCSVCGTAFYSSCPGCQKLIPTSALICPECNLNIGELKKTVFYFNNAKTALARGDFMEANAYLQQVENADPKRIELKKCPDFDAVKQKIEAQYNQFKKYLTNLTALMTAKKFVHAKQEADKVKAENPNIDLASQLKIINENLDKAKSMMPSAGDLSESAACRCYDILDIVSDYLPASDLIKKVPLSPVSGLSAVILKGDKFGVSISFSPSKHSRVSYYLVRNESHPPKSYSDGTILLKDSDKVVYEDYQAISGKKYYYAAFVTREGVFSPGAQATLSAYVDVEKLEANVQGNKCSLSFKLPVNCIGARVIKKENAIPAEGDVGSVVVGNDVHGAIDDNNLPYDRQFGYLVQACYLENNQKIYTKGVGVIVKIERDPADLNNVVIKKEGGIINVTYTSNEIDSSNAVRVYTIHPNIVEKRLHQLLSIAEINDLLKNEKLLGSGKVNNRQVTFTITGNYSYNVVVVSMTDSKGRFVGLGKVSSIELVEVDVKKSEIKEGGKAYVRMKSLPPSLFGIHYMAVDASGAKKEITPEDITRHNSFFISANNYRLEGLISITSRVISAGRFLFLAVGEFVINNEHVFSETSVQEISLSGPKEINYSIEWKKKGLFKKGFTALLHLQCKGEIPALTLMARDNMAPISSTDINAYKILDIDSSTPSNKVGPDHITIELPEGSLYAGMVFRLFSSQSNVKLVSNDYNSLKYPK